MTNERIKIPLPPTYMARDVTLQVERTRRGGRWQIVGLDGVGNAWPCEFDGYTGAVKFATRAGALEMLEAHGGAIGQRLVARGARPVVPLHLGDGL